MERLAPYRKRYVVLAPLSGNKESDWPEERWNEIIEWLDAQERTVVLLAKQVYLRKPGIAEMTMITDNVMPAQIDDIIGGACAIVATCGLVSETARSAGCEGRLVEIDVPAWPVTVGSVLDRLSPLIGLSPLGAPTISACLMVRNELKLLPETVARARRCADEIVVVDTGSTDGTAEWLAEQKDVVTLHYDVGPAIESFSDVRNHGINHATGKYVLWLDAPDWLRDPEGLRDAIRAETSDAYILHSDVGTGGHLRREKVVLRPFAWFQDRVHEYIQLGGLKIESLPAALGIERQISVKVGRESGFDRNVRLLKMSLDESPSDHPQRGRWLFYLGLEYFQERRPDEALPYFYQRLAEGGWVDETFGTLVALGQIMLYHKKDYIQAREIAALLRDLEPACREWTYLMAEAYRLEGATVQAIEWYRMTMRNVHAPSVTWCWDQAIGDAAERHVAELTGNKALVIGR